MRLSDLSVVLAETSSGAPLVLTVVGMVIFFVAGFGAIAALKENMVMIKMFKAVMLIVFVIEIAVGLSAYTYRNQLHSNVSQNFLKVLNKYGYDKPITKGIDGMQQKFQCCGAQNFTDWFNSTLALPTLSVPTSCCRKVQQKCGEDATEHSETIYQEGCVMKMRSWIGQHIGVIGAVGVGFGFAQIFGVLFSCLLVKILQENYSSV
ncbi:CD151 antigen-like isoform X2 [Ascaphus truei]